MSTNKNYEKLYKDALERAKKQRADYQKELDKTDKNSQLAGLLRAGISAIDMTFPQLAENEDEWVPKELIEYLKQKSDYRSCWIAWLEKQKKGLADNSKTSASKDEGIRKWLFNLVNNMSFENLTASESAKNEEWKKKVLAYLEKQKINTEGDFGRGYDCGYQAGYAIAMNEMKPKVATATLDSEKQKESLPIPDKFSGLKSLMLQYLQSAANRKDDTEIERDTDLWGRKVLDYVWKYSDEQKEKNEITIKQVYKEFINPEKLKDAKTNKYIRAQLFWELAHNGIITAVDYQYLIDDNRKPWTEEEYLKAYRKGFDVSEQLKQKEQKSVEWTPKDWNILCDICGYISGTGSSSGITNRERETWLRELPKRFSLEDKEQKPADDKAFEEWIDDWWKHNKMNNPDSYDKGDEIQFDEQWFKSFCRKIKNMCVEQKPAEVAPNQFDGITYGMQGYSTEKPVEWGEEDKAIVGCIACCLDGQFVTEAARKQCLEWFNKHRRDFLNAHHTEWSEEDEKIYKMLSSMIHGTFVVETQETQDKLLSWLKLLRSQSKQKCK